MLVASAFQLQLKRTLEVLHASDGNSYVLRGGAEAEFVVEASTAPERALLDSIAKGAPSLPALCDAVAARGGDASEADVAACVETLAGLGLLEEPAGAAAAGLGADAAQRFD